MRKDIGIATETAVRIRLGDGKVLGHQLADQHRCHVGDEQGHTNGEGGLSVTPLHPIRASKGSNRSGQGRLGDGAGENRGDSDPELGPGQLERESGEEAFDLGGPAIAFLASRLTLLRSTATRANSPATKKAVKRTRTATREAAAGTNRSAPPEGEILGELIPTPVMTNPFST